METIRHILFCPHCSNRAPQRLIHTQEYLEHGYPRDDSVDIQCAYYVVVCETCNEILLYRTFSYVEEDKDFHRANLIWPDPGVLHQSVPKAIGECYVEAARIKNLAPNAFAVQIRRALEALCDDRSAKKGALQLRLQDLVSRGEIPPVLAEMTDVLRLLGNIGAHAVDQSVKPIHVIAIDDFFHVIVEYVYVAPSKLKEFRDWYKGFITKKDTSPDPKK